MLTAHETIKTAWSKFKTYPRFWQIILFNFVATLPIIFMTVGMAEYYQDGDSLSDHILMGSALNFAASILSYIVYFLTGMSITHYVCTGWVFNNFAEFIRPPSSRWRLFWKAFILYILVLIGFLIITGLVGSVMGILPITGQIIIGAVLGFALILGIVFLFTKLILVNPYFTMNDEAPLLSPLKFSDGYFGYLSKILGWMLLYGILLIIAFSILTVGIDFITTTLGTIGLAVVSLGSLIIQAIITMISVFIYSEAYKQIAENKS